MKAQAFPYLPQSPQTTLNTLATDRPKMRRMSFVGEIDGRVVAFGSTWLDIETSVDGAASLSLLVDESHRRQGIATRLLERLESHWTTIGATEITTRLSSEAARTFAEANGFAASRTELISHLPLVELPEMPPIPEGITLRPLSELDDMRILHDIDTTITSDVPADEPWQPLSYEDWRVQYLDDPVTDAESTVLAFDGEQAVALAWMDRVADRAWSSLTGTRREYRGRGLARLVKIAALGRARERGAVAAFTNNDATNAPMLAVNSRLGYRPYTEQYTFVRRLS